MLVANPYWERPEHASAPYGSRSNPACVGGIAGRNPMSTHLYFNRLRGPQGQTVYYNRVGSCCGFPSPNGLFDGGGMLDLYRVTYAGLAEPVDVYVSFYDPAALEAPPGFTLER